MKQAVERSQVTIDGLQTSYLSAGEPSADLVVLFHDGAWGGSADATWGRVIPLLAERYRVIAPDLYGYGSSAKMVQLDVAPHEFRLRQVADLLDALGLEVRPAHVVGNSFGGAMAIRAATTPWFSWRMRSAVSISGTGGPYRTQESLVSLAHFDGTRDDMLRIIRLITGDFDGIDEYVDARLLHASNPGHYRAVAAAGLSTPFATTPKDADTYPESLGDITIPIALVCGTEDVLVEQGWAGLIAAHGPTCDVYEIPGRHSPNISDPQGAAKLLLEILDKHDGRTRSA